MTDLLKEAIADAKAVREVALANAKMALEEAFTPRIQSMLATKLSEEAEGDEEMTEGDEWYMEEGDEYGDEHMEEGEEEEAPVEEAEDEDEPAMEEGEDEEEMPVEEGDDEITDEPAMEEGEYEEEPVDEDLMEIIRQLEEELNSSEIGKGDNKQPSKTASDDHTQDKKEKLVQLVEEEEEEAPAVEEGDDDEVDIQEILRALREEEEEEEMTEGEDEEPAIEEGEESSDDEVEELAEKVNEAYAVIQFLREKLNEVNLLNSKLLFSNKLFRSYSLTETQKVTVIENFDRAGSLREVKLVYATLAESFKGQSMRLPKSQNKKASLKESFASKPQASTRPSKKILTESDQVADRFKKLAGLI